MAKRKWYVEVCKIEAVNRLLNRGEHYGRPILRDLCSASILATAFSAFSRVR